MQGPDLFDSMAPAINASSQWGPALFPPVVQTGATSLREAMAMNAVLRQADGGNGLLSAQYVMPGPLTSYSNIPIQATALSPPLTPPPAPELHQQSRPRFVWTPELHAQAACNTLGLDNAKPKSILKLMDVDGLTKANIKSHLQKYRCMMNKRSAEAGDGEARPAKAPRVQRRAAARAP
ncbi:hypothetical protein EMIHUDRAFT_213196 [Emiliania huxleyi CCMP1516]|uniref:HTH myb-type domain-containing protein n=2 Tax=Emiliania huxleyi TaxID=2903 RepID=A0A0D3INV3_EMIH1|nr:hypothetical protein EMIHUDRAFT_213196 [Emiliania huxleyi CCMP1516]EOD12938.1 hypothetical protein EMIHUDRAFT_213196 [Emiliania huxleyi CCMP1516]|eukprot:XP_005765367.1 hypothetical protein EMIHUDRAFT_213196 [Emiliania huxleyi CCMP1516]